MDILDLINNPSKRQKSLMSTRTGRNKLQKILGYDIPDKTFLTMLPVSGSPKTRVKKYSGGSVRSAQHLKVD